MNTNDTRDMSDTNKTAILIKLASLEFEKIANPILAEYQLTASQYRILKFLYSRQNVSSRVVDIEKQFSITHPTALGLLDKLEKNGFVTKIANPDDARSKLVSLTEKAKVMQPAVESVGERVDNIMTENLSEQEKIQLISLLKKLLNKNTSENQNI